jgi:hypothetical protein
MVHTHIKHTMARLLGLPSSLGTNIMDFLQHEDFMRLLQTGRTTGRQLLARITKMTMWQNDFSTQTQASIKVFQSASNCRELDIDGGLGIDPEHVNAMIENMKELRAVRIHCMSDGESFLGRLSHSVALGRFPRLTELCIDLSLWDRFSMWPRATRAVLNHLNNMIWRSSRWRSLELHCGWSDTLTIPDGVESWLNLVAIETLVIHAPPTRALLWQMITHCTRIQRLGLEGHAAANRVDWQLEDVANAFAKCPSLTRMALTAPTMQDGRLCIEWSTDDARSEWCLDSEAKNIHGKQVRLLMDAVWKSPVVKWKSVVLHLGKSDHWLRRHHTVPSTWRCQRLHLTFDESPEHFDRAWSDTVIRCTLALPELQDLQVTVADHMLVSVDRCARRFRAVCHYSTHIASWLRYGFPAGIDSIEINEPCDQESWSPLAKVLCSEHKGEDALRTLVVGGCSDEEGYTPSPFPEGPLRETVMWPWLQHLKGTLEVFSGMNVASDEIPRFAGWTHLRELGIDLTTPLQASHLLQLQQLPALRVLRISDDTDTTGSDPVTWATLTALLERLPDLRTLDLHQSSPTLSAATGGDTTSWFQSRTLEHLALSLRCRIAVEPWLATWQTCPMLQRMTLTCVLSAEDRSIPETELDPRVANVCRTRVCQFWTIHEGDDVAQALHPKRKDDGRISWPGGTPFC